MTKITLHDLLLHNDLTVPHQSNLKFGENMERFLAIGAQESADNFTFEGITMSNRADGKMVLYSGEGQIVFAVILLCSVIECLSLLEEDLSSTVKMTYRNMIKDETHYRFHIKGSHGKFFSDFVIDRIMHNEGRPSTHGNPWVLLYRWFGFQLRKKDKLELENLLKKVRNIECMVHIIHLN